MSLDLSAVAFRPFTHEVGQPVLVPGSNLILTLYPTRCECTLFGSSEVVQTATFDTPSPAHEFEVMQDIQRQRVIVRASFNQGLLSYYITASEGKAYLKCTRSGVATTLRLQDREEALTQGARFTLLHQVSHNEYNREVVLHMGCFKKQHLPSMQSRFSLSELLPFFFMLGKTYPDKSPWDLPILEEDHPLKALSEAVEVNDKETLPQIIQTLYRSSFRGLLAPIFDQDHHWGGAQVSGVDQQTFLVTLYKLVRSLFIRWDGKKLTLLPCLPKKCAAGRLQHMNLGSQLTISFRWSKKRLFEVQMKAHEACTFSLDIKGYAHGYRYRENRAEKGERRETAEFTLKARQTIYLDRWQT